MTDVTTKAEIIDAIIAKAGSAIPKATVKTVLDLFGEVAKAEIAAGHVVRIPALGSLEKVQREARTGRNPNTGEEIQIPACQVAKFRASLQLKEALNAE